VRIVNYEKYNSLLESQALIQNNAIIRKDKELDDVNIKLSMYKWLISLTFLFGLLRGYYYD